MTDPRFSIHFEGISIFHDGGDPKRKEEDPDESDIDGHSKILRKEVFHRHIIRGRFVA